MNTDQMILPSRTALGDKWQLGEHRLYVSENAEMVRLSIERSYNIMADITGVDLEEEVVMPTAFRGNASFFCTNSQLPSLYSYYAGRNIDLIGIKVFPNEQQNPNGYVDDLKFLFCATRFGIKDRNVEPTANRSRILSCVSFDVDFSEPEQELWENQIRLISEDGEIILDPYAGMGKCMMACLREGRISYSIEPDTYYADVLLSRYEAATASKPVRVSNWR